MAARIARNNGNEAFLVDWNGQAIPPGRLAVVDDASDFVRAAVEGGTLELDPTLGRHYEAPKGPERDVRPTERDAGKAIGPRGRL